ncbi:hypothetical protein Sme01_30860 [Sphaerisporangium melleum]|uniref:Uncharacterized protein n=1 Tax=Sphaerisporangium melleum TaxID=321316 RepID=A0A917VMB2_9ACTN|nr:hypothetical protein [Sphaerisporangium melleum]GGK95491.1 hypothetical protein GCM10007964_42290 [Sphaerisporangium melleum]GII70610.1 hypothetical protein Sme01_30860 [Sphaerisporangium melleum]
MLAIVAAIVFGIAFLFSLLGTSIGISTTALIALGLCLLALHQGGIGTASAGGGAPWRGYRRTRR